MEKIDLVKRTDMFSVPTSKIIEDEGFNVRQDFGDLEALSKSIAENGVINPIRVYKKDGFFVLVDGHRRYRAALMAEQATGMSISIRAVIEPKYANAESRCLDLILTNDGKRLEPFEEAEIYKRLIAFGWTQSRIAKQVGKSDQYIGNLLSFTQVDTEVKQAVADGIITTSLVVDALKASSGTEEAEIAIKAAIKKAGGKAVKREDVKGVDRKVSLNKIGLVADELEAEPLIHHVVGLTARIIYQYMSGAISQADCMRELKELKI